MDKELLFDFFLVLWAASVGACIYSLICIPQDQYRWIPHILTWVFVICIEKTRQSIKKDYDNRQNNPSTT